jgi:hypothetical protein
MLHEVWLDAEGLPMLCLAGRYGKQARAMLSQPSHLIHTFGASSHFEAMTIYYVFMNWGKYTSDFWQDHQTYAEWGFE